MQEVSHLRLARWARAARWALALAAVCALSCSHLQTPEFVGPGEFATPDEYMNSSEVRAQHAQHRPVVRGPFQLRWPVANPIINRGFLNGKRPHNGLDLKGRKNEPVYAAHDGYVVYAGSKFRGYGKMIILEYDDGWATLYGHLNKFKVKTGQEVKAGEEIGAMGRTGRATGVHLHFEVIRNKIPVDPLPLLEKSRIVQTGAE